MLSLSRTSVAYAAPLQTKLVETPSLGARWWSTICLGTRLPQTVTDASGVYSTAPIDSGSYKVYFNPTDGIHRYEYYNNQLTSSTANTVTVVGGQDTLNINGVLSNKACIVGTVTDETTGSPISGCQVRVYNLSWAQVALVTTNASGNYITPVGAPGSYKVGFNPTDGIHRSELYNNKFTTATADTVVISSGQDVSDINAQLIYVGAITGTVTGSETGSPGARQHRSEDIYF